MDGMDGGSEYGTPAAESLFSTPASTPRRITYRMNPVKLVRQHVPLKLQSSSEYSGQNVLPDRDSLNSNSSSINPMRTTRIKCVIQPTSSYGDCIEARLLNSPRTTNSEVSPRSSTNSLIVNNEVQNERPNLVVFSDFLTPKIPQGTVQRILQRNARGDAENVDQVVGDGQREPLATIETVPSWPAVVPPLELAEFNAELPKILKSVAAVEKEVASIDRLIKNRLEEINEEGHEMDEQTTKPKNNVEPQSSDATVDRSKKDGKRKVLAKNVITPKSNVNTNTDANSTQTCEKKKFYDPQAVRKYMMKKKNERRAKEKEEKSKKANELAALKRKVEVTKSLSQRSRSCSEQQVNEPKNTKPLKNSRVSKTNEKSPNEKKATTAVAKPKPNSDPRKGGIDVGKCDDHRSVGGAIGRPGDSVAIKSQKLVECDFNDVEKTGRYFEEKFNDIVAKCVNEVNKIANLDLRTWAEGSKMTRTDFEVSTNRKETSKSIALPPEVDVLRPNKNSYNFLDALKSKINLAKNTNDDLLVTPLADRTRRENVLEKRRRLEIPISLVDDESQILIKPELTLSDLNSPQRKVSNETYTDEGAEMAADRGSETFILNTTNDLKRKSPKSSRNSTALKENRRPAKLDVSGVSPLMASTESLLTAAADKSIMNLVNEYNEQRESTQPRLANSDANLVEIFNLESLKTPNLSVSLPQAWSCDNNREVTKNDDEVVEVESSAYALENVSSMTSTVLLAELYDQMIKNEDDKLAQILRKIQQQKEALNKHLKTEIFTLELRKNQFREKKEEDKVKAVKKKQRAVLLRITKNIMELDRMKKSVVETVEQRKAELMKMKNLAKVGRSPSKMRQQNLKPRKRTESNNAAYMISNQTMFGISTSSCTSFVMDGENKDIATINTSKEIIGRKILEIMNTESISKDEIIRANDDNDGVRKDTATSPVHFKPDISIRLDLDAGRLLQLKNSTSRLKIEAKAVDIRDSTDTSNALALEPAPSAPVTPVMKDISNFARKDDSGSEYDVQDVGSGSKSIKIKRPLSPVVFSSSKKILHSRRQSSGSDLTLPSFNDTTTTDQSDLEIRISALQEQLTQRKLEAERLRKEEKKLRKEKLRSKEQSLIKQLEAYDQYIQRLTKLLAENRTVLREAAAAAAAASKPQIKSFATVRRKHAVHESWPATASSAAATSSTPDALHSDDRRYDVEDGDADTNTEDSDSKEVLRKADSGILVESEGVTEASENANTSSLPVGETAASKSETRSSTENEPPPPPHTAVSSQPRSAPRGDPSNQFLQLVNDLQSEVLSMSEQLYSSDFVDEDIEDVAETKSELSENVTTNENNTSMSIEEILTDNHSDTSKRVAAADDETAQSISGTVRTAIESVDLVETDLSQQQQQQQLESPSKDVVPSVISSLDEGGLPTPSPLSEQVVEESIVTRSEVETEVEEAVLREKSATTSELESNQVERAESISDGEFDFYNVQNISAIESLEEDSKTLSEGQIISSVPKSEPTLTGDEEILLHSAANIIDEILSVSSLSDRIPLPEEMTEPRRLFGGAELESANVEADIAPSAPRPEPNLERTTMRKFSFGRFESVDVAADAVEERPPAQAASELGAEETDISESLEYDGALVESPDDASSPLHSAARVTDLDEEDDHEKDLISFDSGTIGSHEEDRSVGEIVAAADCSVSNVFGRTFISFDEEGEEEVEESAYVESVDDDTKNSAPIVTSPAESSVDTRMSADEDLDTKISEGETPFLRALRREQENLFARKSESVDKIVIELMDTLMEEQRQGSVVRAAGAENRDGDSENLQTDGPKSKVQDEEKSEIFEELTKSTSAERFGHSAWYEKLDLTEERLREAEELRLQQMKIEQEIGELQAQQNSPPYIYFREIPNKPPPPYTPPSGLARIPNTENELRGQLQPIIKRVCAQLEDGVDANDIQLEDNATSNKTHRDVTAYRRFLFDLTKEVAQSLLAKEEASSSSRQQQQQQVLPWEEVTSRKRILPRSKPTGEQLQQMVEKKINELFGFRSKVNREKLIIQWSRKKKTDFVDDLLIQELQDEEDEWIDYERDELYIKNEITKSLLDELVQDTVVNLQTAWQKKGQCS